MKRADSHPFADYVSLHDCGQRREDACNRIRQRTNSSRPRGPAPFVEQLETMLDRILHPQKPGPAKCIKAERNQK